MTDADRLESPSPESLGPIGWHVKSGGAGWFRSRPAAMFSGAALVTAAAVLPLFRQTGTRSWQSIWSEDGFEYSEQAIRHGGFGLLFRGYGGYVQLPPRLLAALTTAIPIQYLSVYLAISAAIVGALLAWFIYHASDQWIASRPVRLALASLIVLMPVLGAENTANITNTIWIFAAVAPWALVSLAERPSEIVIRCVVGLLAALSSSLCFLFLPLGIGFAIFRRSRGAAIVTGAFTAGLVLQGIAMIHTRDAVPALPQSFHLFHRSASGIADAIGLKVFGMYLVGYKGTTTPWLVHHHLLAIGGTVCILLVLVVLATGSSRNHQVLAAVFVAYALITFAAPVWNRRDVAPRYSVIPIVLLASAIAVLVGDPIRVRGEWIARIGRPLFIAQIAVLAVIGFSVTTYRSENPPWTDSVAFVSHSSCHRASPNKLVVITTDAYNLWPVTLTCHDIAP